jgi:hypothetical protein
VDLAWGTATLDTLVALIEPATLIFVHAGSGTVLRSYTLPYSAVLTALAVNPWDAASFALASMSGTLVLAGVEEAEGRVLGRQIAVPGAGAPPAKVIVMHQDCDLLWSKACSDEQGRFCDKAILDQI